MKGLIATCALLCVAFPAMAIDGGQAFEDPELQARYENIIAEVRCLKCQNQTIKDSNAFLAADLRREIRNMIEAGKTDGEIAEFLVARYGEFALYRPRASGKTLILWLAPGIFLLGGAVVLWRVLQRRMTLPIDDESVDAVTIAAPDHWHGTAALLAIEVGKHVYVEKPFAHNHREGRLLVDAARRRKRVVQHGTQARSSEGIRNAIQMLHEGVIGKVMAAKAWNIQRRSSIGRGNTKRAGSP